MTYYVQDNNWSNEVSTAISSYTYPDNFDGKYQYKIPGDGTANDPAIGCSKDFKANYTCGAETTQRSIPTISNAGYSGEKIAQFNCSSTYNQCNQLKLVLGNDGSLTVRDPSGNKDLWTNKNDVSLIGLESIALVDSNSGDRTLRQGDDGVLNNYLLPGEFLGEGEYIISPNNKFRLVLDISGITTELKVIYNSSGCTPTTNGIILDASASKLYKLNSSRTDIGKLGYVDELGILHEYPASMTGYSSEFEMVGNYGLDGGDIELPTVVSNEEMCENKCAEYNNANANATKCVGFVYEKVGKTCQMKDNTIYTSGTRFINNNYEYYMRNKSIYGQDVSCPQTLDPGTNKLGTNEDWGTFATNSKEGIGMSGNIKCGLGKFTAAETAAVQQADLSLNSVSNALLSFKNTLLVRYNTIKNILTNNSSNIDTKLNDLQNSRRDLGDWSGEQLKQLDAMNEDRDLNRISQNYKHILWSILAIIIIIAAIRITRTVSTPTV